MVPREKTMLIQNLGGQTQEYYGIFRFGQLISRSTITCRLDVRGLDPVKVTSDVFSH